MPLAPAGSKVFIIDDDAAVRVSIADLLQSAGLASETFGTPQEFLPPAAVTARAASCWTCDFPGWTVSPCSARSRGGITMPIIFLTAFADVPTTVKAMKSARWSS